MSDQKLIHEVKRLAEFLQEARHEVSAILAAQDSAGAQKNIPHIADELTEVIRHTEEATNTIMDQVEKIQAMSLDATKLDVGALGGAAMNIMEACSFQDITGQRIRKVIAIVEQVEQRLDKLVAMLGGMNSGDTIVALATGKERPDEALMAGPQLRGQGVSQADVDKLLSGS